MPTHQPLRGRLPVTVLIAWRPDGSPRNVLIRRLDGAPVIRPFRRLRRVQGGRA